MALNTEKIRKDFQILQSKKPPIYFDNACMPLRPTQVINKIVEYYKEYPSCAGRSVHTLSKKVDEEVYLARKKIQKFIGAKNPNEIIFLRNTTEGINLIAQTHKFKAGDVVLTTDKEHNSNLLPWQKLAKEKNVKHEVLDSNNDNTFSLENFKSRIEEHKGKVKLVAIGHTSNLDGVTNPVKEISKIAHKNGAKIMLDAAQSTPHKEINTGKTGADFIAFSGHKMMGPTGTGVLWGKKEELEKLNHYNVGGETVLDSWHDKEGIFEKIPRKFEAGLQHYSGITGLGEAASYLKKIGLKNIHKHEIKLNKQLYEEIQNLKGLEIIGPIKASLRGGITSFNIKGLGPHDIAGMLNSSDKIMIRSGAHCVHSWFNKHKMVGSARSSLYLYNTEKEITTFAENIKKIAKLAR